MDSHEIKNAPVVVLSGEICTRHRRSIVAKVMACDVDFGVGVENAVSGQNGRDLRSPDEHHRGHGTEVGEERVSNLVDKRIAI